MDYRHELILLAETYAAATKRSVARISTLVRNDGKFFDKLKGGAGCTMDTYQSSLRWFSQNWPADTPWPESIARPTAETTPASAAE